MADAIAHHSGLYEPFYCDESRLEAHLSALSPSIFSDYIWCNFKPDIWSEYGNVRPDAALISRDYDRWYVVEVELARHSWTDHVQPQLTKLLHGRYERRHRQYLLSNNSQLDAVRIENLNIYNPEFLLIIETSPDYIRRWCHQNGILCLQASPYRSINNQYALTLLGDRPASRPNPVIKIADAVIQLIARDTLVPQLSYRFDCPLANITDNFEVQIGASRYLAQNFGDNPVSIVLSCELQAFLNAIGEAASYNVYLVEPGVYEITPGRSNVS